MVTLRFLLVVLSFPLLVFTLPEVGFCLPVTFFRLEPAGAQRSPLLRHHWRTRFALFRRARSRCLWRVARCAVSMAAPSWPNFEAARVQAVEAYLLECHVQTISWHTVLNNHASTRPKEHGGPLVTAVRKCKVYAASGADGWRCTLTLPNSFAAGDGRQLVATGESATKVQASELACLRAVALLVTENPGQVLFRDAHWKVPADEVKANLPGLAAADPASGGHALPVHTPARLQGAGSEADAPDADARLLELVEDILKTHGGEFDPSRISYKKLRSWRAEPPWETFNKLLKPGGLKGFVEKHSDKFAWRLAAGKNEGMLITWANWVTQEEEPVPPPWERPATGEVAPLPLACPPAVATAPQQGVASGSGLKRPDEGAADAMGFPPPKSGGPVPRSHPNN